MTRSLLDRQSELPRSLPLFRYAPACIRFSWTESVALWDQPRTTRSFLQFARPGEAKTIPTVEQVIDAERNAQAALAKVEAISGAVVATIEQMFQQVTKGAS